MLFEEEEAASWPQTNINGGFGNREEMEMGALSTFKSILEKAEDEDLYLNNTASVAGVAAMQHGMSFSASFNESSDNNQMLLHQVNSSASCSPSSASVFKNHDSSHHQVNYFLPPKSLIQTVPNNPFQTTFDVSNFESGFLGSAMNTGNSFNDIGAQTQMSTIDFSSNTGFGIPETTQGIHPLFFNRPKILKPLENFPSIGATKPTLFQKRAALRKNIGNSNLGCHFNLENDNKGSNTNEKKSKESSGEDLLEDISIGDQSYACYDSDDQFFENNASDVSKLEESDKNVGSSTAVGSGDRKGKKKGLPAKNLMAERRRRKKLNDRLYMLRSVVPRISKMDRASILGDATEYLKELLQKINDLQNELESNPSTSSMTPTTSFYPLTPTTPGFPPHVKEERSPSAFASPLSSPTGRPARVEVRLREGRAVNIHMICGRRPGLLLSTMRAMDSLGLDVQQAVISCFNGFTLDIFRAEQWQEGQSLHPDQIKAVLLDSAGFHGFV